MVRSTPRPSVAPGLAPRVKPPGLGYWGSLLLAALVGALMAWASKPPRRLRLGLEVSGGVPLLLPKAVSEPGPRGRDWMSPEGSWTSERRMSGLRCRRQRPKGLPLRRRHGRCSRSVKLEKNTV